MCSPNLNYVSPSFTHEKLESPTFQDLVDVFEDRMREWLLNPAKILLDTEHGSVAAVGICLSYFEGIEIYLRGQDSKGRSRDFFHSAFFKVFSVRGASQELLGKIADEFYEQVRCGFAHDGIFRRRVLFSHEIVKPILVSPAKTNGEFDPTKNFGSIMINPRKFVEAVEVHFGNYVNQLRNGDSDNLANKFQAAVDLKWGLNEPEPVVGMTEEEFLRGALPS